MPQQGYILRGIPDRNGGTEAKLRFPVDERRGTWYNACAGEMLRVKGTGQP